MFFIYFSCWLYFFLALECECNILVLYSIFFWISYKLYCLFVLIYFWIVFYRPIIFQKHAHTVEVYNCCINFFICLLISSSSSVNLVTSLFLALFVLKTLNDLSIGFILIYSSFTSCSLIPV